jgi:hypothetical protein
MLFKADTTGSKSSSEKLTAFQKEPGDIIVSRAPYHLCQNLVEFESIKLEPHSPIVLPQTLVVIDGVVKLRLRFCSDFTERVLKDQIRQALETRTAFSASQ